MPRTLAAALAGLAWATSATAACPSAEEVLPALSCSSPVTDQIVYTETSDLGGTCGSSSCYTCGTPTANRTQTQAERVYQFTCEATGTATITMSGMDCDLDLYVIDDTCDPNGSSCLAGATGTSSSTDSVSFSCTAGTTYYVVVEGYGFSLSGSSAQVCSGTGEGDFTLTVSTGSGTACPEDCNDSVDNDGDTRSDCRDTDCTTECDSDLDGDGHDASTFGGDDCDDSNYYVNPSVDEVCDGIDNDCDGRTDTSATDATTYYRDSDSDGYGNPSSTTTSCSTVSGYVTNDDDCDDTRNTTYPGATETCDTRDNDCDGTADDGLSTTWYRDADSDGYGSPTATTSSCSAPLGYVANDDDCDDANSGVSPADAEFCDSRDNDCDGVVDDGVGTTYYRDADIDGYGTPSTTTISCSLPSGYVSNSGDCNDADSAINPEGEEVCDGADNDCDGGIDNIGSRYWYYDADGDGWGDEDNGTFACTPPAGYVGPPGDCDDTDSSIYPDAPEVCNSLDDDCDSRIDEAGGSTTWYGDGDGDGYGDASTTSNACDIPTDYVTNSTDCNDEDSAVHPGATEVCNGGDDDCDGTADDGAGTTWYADNDRDGYGNPARTTSACVAPSGYTSNGSDCDDSASSVYPGASETCNSVDDDCDGAVDDNAGATWYADADGDGYGNLSVTASGCSAPAGYVGDSTDCYDGAASIHPGATEYCNGIDDDCDGSADEDAFDTSYWFLDADGDGYGDSGSILESCDAPTGYVGPDGDCWDDASDVYPGASETGDGVDQDCDGIVDEGTELYDDDGDGFAEVGGDCDDAASGTSPVGTEFCDGADNDCDTVTDETTECSDDDGDGYTENDGDCNDADAAVNPARPEDTDNGLDDDCDGGVDLGSYDPDGDGYSEAAGDCSEFDPSVYPGATESENGADDDCDGVTDEGTGAYDDDGDGMADNDGDCDDTNAATYEGAKETVDGVDNNCDGLVDEGSAASDDDGDGFTEEGGDCDDADPAVNPAAEETLNTLDDNCDDHVDEFLTDADGDGFTVEDGDCDDQDGWANPDGDEICDGIDNDCNATVDDGCLEETGTYKPTGCGSCSSTAAAPGLLLALGAVLLAGRRRA